MLTRVVIAAACLLAVAHAACNHDKLTNKIKASYLAAGHVGNPFHFQRNAPEHRALRERELQIVEVDNLRIGLITDRLLPGGDPGYACENGTDSFYSGETGTLDVVGPFECTDADVMSDEARAYLINTVLPAAVEWHARSLRVRPYDADARGALPLEQFDFCAGFSCCAQGQPFAPALDTSQYSFTNADVVFDVTARPSAPGVVAYALACSGDPLSGRPLFGQLNFVPAQFSTNPALFQQTVAVAAHEMAHALGFSSNLYDSFVDFDTLEPVPFSQVVQSKFSPELEKEVARIVMPEVRNAFNKHLGCDSHAVPGIELEDAGGAGTAGSHWEARLMNTDYMIGFVGPVMQNSDLTLAFFHATGFYRADYSTADPFRFGKNQGCKWATEKCSSWPNPQYFCNADSVCSAGHTSKGFCFVQGGQTIPPEFQYFPDPSVGGPEPWDFCPVVIAFSPFDSCLTPHNFVDSSRGEVPGNPGAACFANTLGLGSPQSVTGSCMQWSCSGPNNELVISLGGGATQVVCPPRGGDVQLSGEFTGTITCPPASDFGCGSSGPPPSGDCQLPPSIRWYEPHNNPGIMPGPIMPMQAYWQACPTCPPPQPVVVLGDTTWVRPPSFEGRYFPARDECAEEEQVPLV